MRGRGGGIYVPKTLARLLPLLLLACLYPAAVGAQQPNRIPQLNLGDAVVTGFSGTLAPDAGKPRPANKSVIDLTFINPDGPSARIVGLGRPGFVWDGRLFPAPKTFDVLAKDVGQVFGVALDDATPPNIYLAATSLFGLNIVSRGRDGLPERRKKGGPGAGWMKGQFGLDLQGGPGAIYKVDGRTGVVTLFANVTLDGVPNPGLGLGNLAYDSAHKQLFVSDLYTGMIHRFALDGRDLGPPYDHGVTARPTRGNVPAQPFDPRRRLNIASDRFDSENPETWGFAPPPRRVWALAVHDGRLYYSARNEAPANGPQIWSVGIAQDGNFAADPRWELDVPAEPGPYAVSDIAFSQDGAMILAQRAPIAGSYDYSAFTQAGEPRVLRYWLKDPNDPPSPGRWKPVPDEYAIGFAGNYRNSNGGVALGYGYGTDGTLQTQACEAALWSTGQHLRDNPALRSQLEPGGPLVVNGLQGSPAGLVRNANTPPATSYFIDYDDAFDDARAAGHMGSVRILTQPCAASAIAQRIAPPGIATPIGCIGPGCRPQVCEPTCVCPEGTVLEGKECVKPRPCPEPFVPGPVAGSCVCPQGTVLQNGTCVRVQTLRRCPPGTILVNGNCVPVKECRPPLVLGPHGTCICPPGTVQQGETCVPQICPPPLVPGPCNCPDGTVQDGRLCVTSIDLQIGKEDTAGGGSGTWFNVWVTNAGPPITFPAGGVTVTENIPAGMTVTGVTGTGWTCVPPTMVGPGQMHCTYNLAGSLATGASLSSTMFVHYTTSGPGPFVNCATVGIVASVGIDGNPSNDTACATVTPTQLGSLSVTKIVAPDPRGIGNTLIFPMTVTCTNPNASYTLNVHGNTSTLPINVPVGSHCTVAETQPALPAGCTWLPPIFAPPGGVTIASGLNHETVTNGYRCREICPPPQVMIPGVGCRCPDGEVLVDGKCVKPEVCKPPLVMIPGVGCMCPDGTELVDGKCVKKIVCKPPLVPNANGTDCVCKDNLVLRRGKCVEREKPKRETCKRGFVWNGDMCVRRKTEPKDEKPRERQRQDLPGFNPGGGGFPGGGGGGRGSEGGTPKR